MASSDLSQFILGNYQLIEVLGIGAMGYVYRARQLNLNRDVAVKVLSPSLAREIGYVDLFLREARTAASLEHTHIVPVIDYGVQQDISYVAMRLLPGGSLGDRIKWRLDHQKPLPSLREISRIVSQAASALDYAHERGVIHRDIKPNNLMFDQQGEVYVVDFGIAKLIGTTSSIKGSTFLGTPSFMAPEQWQGHPPTPAVDQYAFGAAAYMMVTGHPPFESEIALALMNKHLREQPPDVQQFRSSAPNELNAVLQRAMAKEPQDRFATNMAFAEAFAQTIRNVDEQESTGFTTFALPQVPLPLPLPLSTSSSFRGAPANVTAASTSAGRAADPVSSAQKQNLSLIQSGLIVLLAVALVALLVSRQPSAEPLLTPTVPTAETAAVSGDAIVLAPENTFTYTPAATIPPTVPPASTSTTEIAVTVPAHSGTPATPSATISPTVTVLPSHTSTSTSTSSPLPTQTSTFTATWTLTPSHTPSATPSHTPSATRTATPTTTPSSTPSPTATASPSPTPTSTATETATAVRVPNPTVNWRAGTQLKIGNPNGAWLRTNPSTRAGVVSTLAHNNPVTATGDRHFDGRQWWWEVTAEWGAVGWVEQFSLVER